MIQHSQYYKQLCFTSSFCCISCRFHSIHTSANGGAIQLVYNDGTAYLNESIFEECRVNENKYTGGAVMIDKSSMASDRCCFIKCWAYDNGCGMSHNRISSVGTPFSIMESTLFLLNGDSTVYEDGGFYVIGQRLVIHNVNLSRNIAKTAQGGTYRGSTSPACSLKWIHAVGMPYTTIIHNAGRLVASYMNFIDCECFLRLVTSGTHNISHAAFINSYKITLTSDSITLLLVNCVFTQQYTLVSSGAIHSDSVYAIDSNATNVEFELGNIEEHCAFISLHFTQKQKNAFFWRTLLIQKMFIL